MDMFTRLARYDNFAKSKEHVTVRTMSGVAVSLAMITIMLTLFVTEIVWYRTTRIENHLLVDSSQGDRDVDIRLDIVFHNLRCQEVDFRVEDAKGQIYDEARIHIVKVPHVDGVDRPTDDKAASCRAHGTLTVRKVAGNFHVSPSRMMGGGGMQFNMALDMSKFNASHTVRHLAFGSHFPGQSSPLNGYRSVGTLNSAMYQYHIKVVPTLYTRLDGHVIDSSQFSVSDFVLETVPAEGLMVQPGAWFRYDFSPIMVRVVETRHSLPEFLVSICGICGGVFALSGIVDQILYRGLQMNKKD